MPHLALAEASSHPLTSTGNLQTFFLPAAVCSQPGNHPTTHTHTQPANTRTSQELVRDDNAEHAALLLPLEGLSCLYTRRRTDYYFECLVLALEWDRSQHTFRQASLGGC